MSHKKMLSAAVVSLLITVGTTGSVVAADGASLYQAKGCAACHGPKGDTPIAPNYPKISGQNAQYALAQMKDIKSGARANGLTVVMKPIVSGISDAELEAIAEWLGSL